ncbi:MAG: S1 RNA-binding domain-containing protein [Oligoflexia bacterium]|nr:S1 RNA-binding domain-containing protein [Oligoflexia bacterium]
MTTHHDDADSFKDESQDSEELEGASKKRDSEFARMLEASFKTPTKKLSPGDKIRGEILVAGKEEVFVSTGTMHDGIVARRDLLDAEGNFPHKVGDQLDLYVTQVRGSEIRLSPKPTAKNIAEDLEDAFDMMLPIEGRVAEVCKGGVRVNIRGKLAFCPISQLDLSRTETGEEFVGQKLEFLITQFSEGGRNIVVSRRKLLEEQRGLSQGSFLEEKHEGDIVPGKVMRLEAFGAFVEVAPGIQGLAHISELSWSRVATPHEAVSVGQELSFKILKIENKEGKLKISLSLKQAGAQPWDSLPLQIAPGQVLDGKVTRCMKFGAFVELVPGVEGLIPLSEMSYTKRVVRSDELVKEGERITVMVKEVNPETRRISLSLKDAGSDPWALVAQKFPVGAIFSGRVERKEPYGIFVKLEEGITGLLPKSKAAEHPEFPFEKLKVGDTATVQVAEIRREERRISLDVPKDPGSEDWKNYSEKSTGSFGTLGDKLKRALEKKGK